MISFGISTFVNTFLPSRQQHYHQPVSLHQYYKIAKREDTEPEEEPDDVPKRPFDVIYSWVDELDIPKDSYELMYR